MTKNRWLVFQLKHKISKKRNLFSLMEKMLVIQFHSMEKTLNIQFHIIEKNAYFAIFIHLLFLYETV